MSLNDYYEIKGVIPTIGIISAGKSTFLSALLGTDILEVGETTITEFILFIKKSKSNEYLFQKIRPFDGKDNLGKFIKVGEPISEIEKIKSKIKELNEEFKKNNADINDLLYILEIPILTINNNFLLENYCFMDFPGLNENNSQEKYIKIFEKLTSKLIKFEIIIFDSTSIGSNNIKNILIKIDKVKCLNKEKNLIILNKIDACEKEKREEIIEEFYFDFYNNFGDGTLKKTKSKNKNKENKENKENNLYIDIYKNTFIPFNSLLFKSENILSVNNNFTCLLEKELFNYLEEKGDSSSFYDYLNKKLLNILMEENNPFESLNLLNDIKEEEEDIINDAYDNIIELIEKIKPLNFHFGIDISEEKQFATLEKIYNLYENNKWRITYSIMFNKIKNFFENIREFEYEENNNIKNAKEISRLYNNALINSMKKSMSCLSFDKSNEIRKSFNLALEEESNEKKDEYEDNNYEKKIKILEQLDDFINNKLNEFIKKSKKTEQEKANFKNLTNCINCIKENVKKKKIRISFIGNLSVGKSSILNCIIGEDILPVKQTQCTYRGIIIRYRNDNQYKLYKTKIHENGKGSILYYYFEDEKIPLCEGKENIKSHLINKNKDNNVSDEDAFFVLTGRLKFFDNFENDNEFLAFKNIFEFIDLPGLNANDNSFNENGFYKKILKFTNCCVYVNIPSTIDDSDSYNILKEQYISDKEKLSSHLRDNFINSCVFLINKSDILSSEPIKLKSNISKNIISLINNIDNNNTKNNNSEIKIPFFSAKFYFEFLKLYEKYGSLIEDNIRELWNMWLRNWNNTSGIINFEEYIKNELNNDKEKLQLNITYNNKNEFLEKQLLEIYKKFLKENKNNLKELKNIREINLSIIQLNYSLKIFEKLDKEYIYLANYKPYQFLEKLFIEYKNENQNNFYEFINKKLENDKKILLRRRKRKNEICKISNESEKSSAKANFIDKIMSPFNDICKKNKIIIRDELKYNIVNQIYEISELLEKYSIKFSNSFYQFLKEAINVSNDLQRKNFEFLVNKFFFENLDDLFQADIKLKKIKENKKMKKAYNNFLNKIENEFIPEIEIIIKKKILFIKNISNEVELFIIKLINEEKKNAKIKIEEAQKELDERISEKKQEIKGTFDIEERSRLELELKNIKNEDVFEIAFKKLIKKLEEKIEKEFIIMKEEIELMIKEIEIKIQEKKKYIYEDINMKELPEEDKEQFLLFLRENISYFYNLSSVIETGLISTFGLILRGVIVGLTTSAIIGGTIGSSFGLPGLIIGSVIGLSSGVVSLIVQNLKKGVKYEKALTKINDLITEKIKNKFDNLISSLEEYQEDIKNGLKMKLEVEKNKINNINFEDFKKEYIREKESIMIKIKELL